MRNRVEDLGRLSVLLDQVLDSPAFAFNDWFSSLDLTNLPSFEEKLSKHVSDLSQLREKLLECLDVSQGEDTLNRSLHCQD